MYKYKSRAEEDEGRASCPFRALSVSTHLTSDRNEMSWLLANEDVLAEMRVGKAKYCKWVKEESEVRLNFQFLSLKRIQLTAN